MRASRLSRTAAIAATGIAAMLLVITTLALAQPPAGIAPDPQDGKPDAASLRAVSMTPWIKWVNDIPWGPELIVTVETSDTIRIVDVVTTLPTEPLELREQWNPDHLHLLNAQAEPAGSEIVTDEGILSWTLPEGDERVFTLTKEFHVEPCTWQRTVLEEALESQDQLIEERPVNINKEPPDLWIDSFFDVAVVPGEVATFTLSYGNTGGYENDVFIRNEFPPEAPFDSSDPPPDDTGPDGAWARWNFEGLAKGDEGEITVAVAIQETLAPSTTIEIWDWIYDHVGEEWDSAQTVFHVEGPPDVAWEKYVNGERWYPELVVTTETSATIEVVDVVSTLPTEPLELREQWNPDHLHLLNAQAEPAGSEIVTDEGILSWTLPEGDERVFTLTKEFHVEPCTWQRTVLEEALESQDQLIEERPVNINKEPPDLWIDSFFDVAVVPGEVATFTLSYGNTGGYENDVFIRNEFPPEAPFDSSDPPPDDTGPDGAWARWNFEGLAKGDEGEITVAVAIQETLAPSTTIEIWDWIYDHVGEERDSVRTVFHVEEPLQPPIDFPGGDWPWYAQGEITVAPEPPLVGQPTHVCGEVVNNDPTQPHTVILEFAVANFGIGLPFAPIGHTQLTVPPGSHATGCVVWVPPTPGHWCIEARLIHPGEDEPYRISQRNVDADEPLQPNIPHDRTFSVGNPFPEAMTVTLGLIPHATGWGLELSQDILPDMAPGEVREVTLTATPPDNLPADGTVIVDVEAYAMGEPEPFGGFRKVFRPPIILHRFPDPPYAEREITVHPYPAMAGRPTEVCVELHNPTSVPHDVVVQFSWANFGIGIPFTPINGPRPVHLPPHSLIKECIHWVPPVSGHICLEVELSMDGYLPQRSQRNIDVNEPLRPLEPHSISFPVGNPLNEEATVMLEAFVHLPDWEAVLSPRQLPDMSPGEVREVMLTVIPGDLPADNTPVVDVEAYANGERIGGFRKVFRPPVVLHPLPDPPYAEREITVHPEPPLAGWPTQICVELHNLSSDPHDVMAQFSWANFGMGISFTPINGPRPVHLPPHGVVNECIHWVPPVGGHVCVEVELSMEGYEDQRSQRNVDVAEVLVPGEPDSVTFQVRNPLPETVTATLGVITHLSGWQVEVSPDRLPNMAPGETRQATLTVIPGELPDDGDIVVEVEAYAQHRLIGGFRKMFRPPIPIHRPKDPTYAESEIFVDPYPVLAGVPTKLGVELFNPTDQDEIVTATFSIAHFGIGLPFTTSHIAPNPIQIFVPRHNAARGYVIWDPPLWPGKACIRVTLEVEGHEQVWSQRNIDVGEPLRPGRPHELTFPVGVWPHQEPMTVTLGLVPHKPWEMEVTPSVLPNVGPGQPVMVTLIVTPPVGVQLGTGDPIVDVEAFADGELIGGFRKLDIPPIPVHKAHEPTYAESEIEVTPYPPKAGQPTQVSAKLQNASDETATVEVTFGWAKFGAGIPFTTTGMSPPTRTLSLAPHATGAASVTWTPITSGHQCLQVVLTDPAGTFMPRASQRNVDITERPPCGTTRVFSFTVYNDSPDVVTVDIGLLTFNVPPDWQVTTVPSSTVTIGPHSEAVIRVIVEIPCQNRLTAMAARQEIFALQEEAGSVPTIDVEAYTDGELIGGIELQFPAPVERLVYLPVILRSAP